MEELWRSRSCLLSALAVGCLYLLNLSFCCSLNDEGLALLRVKEKVFSDPYGALSNWKDEVGVENPCSWVGVGCSEGYVVVLNLKDLCLNGTLAPDIGNLVHVKSIILRNNSFFGVIPKELASLKRLEFLDLRYNNFSGHIPCNPHNKFSIGFLLVDNNEFLDKMQPNIYGLQKLSEVQLQDDLLTTAAQTVSCNGLLISWNSEEAKDLSGRKLLQISSRRTPALRVIFRSPPPQEFGSIQVPPPPHHSWSPLNLAPSPPLSPAVVVPSPSPSPDIHISPSSLATPEEEPSTSSQNSLMGSHLGVVLLASIGGPLLILLLVGGILFFHFNKMATVNPWRTGLSGQLQKAFVTGVPKLKRSELVAACEDFSNVIGSSSVCNLYKGTLSNGVEIAVVSTVVASAKEWSNSLESNFRKKIGTLSKVNHKNFVCLLGYCVEEEPFTRMMVFEYAPNGTLFEHLHIREAEHLDWATRLRIAMGVAYCLEHMHQLTHPLAHRNLTSSSVYLTEDYAGKVSDFIYQNEGNLDKIEPNTQSNVYSFGVVLFEMMTGRLPYSVGGESLENWASDYLRVQPLREIVDPTLRTYHEEQLQVIGNVIKMCTNPEPRRRPSMQEVCMMLKEVTGIGPHGAVPKISPLWWAELEILSTEAN
ncbi:inactive receptor-like serine/threonine-protein kinase At2g40270 isoform X1 [Primulina tabacum]|uniref:inactive receptor-like serine/threonine-protein kinase At2g40270 isoform X1 n=1 Tax=Primulina tabacum TaxID=48773 RepID=UPI003F59FC7A